MGDFHPKPYTAQTLDPKLALNCLKPTILKEKSLVPDIIIVSATVSACEKGAEWQQVPWRCALLVAEKLTGSS